MIPFSKHTQISLSFFLTAAILGLLLRSSVIFDIEFIYRYVVHAHSHVALMGWIHFGLATLICFYFFKSNIPRKIYRRIFGGMLFSVAGMLASFPFQGYAFFSIFFSSTFLITTYFYAWAFFKYAPNVIKKNTPSYKVIRCALIYMLISSIGPWSVGGIMATLGQDPFWYNVTIYFYLHFQYNAWIILALLGVFLKILENNNIYFPENDFKYFLRIFNASAILTFFISILFSIPPHEFYVLALLGAFLQFIAFFVFLKFIQQRKAKINKLFSPLSIQLFKWTIGLFFIKISMQLLGSFPYTAYLVTINNYLAIGFLHWVFLGIATLCLFALLEKSGLMKINKISIISYLISFIFTEAIIFYRPVARIFNLKIASSYYTYLFIASILLVISILYLLLLQIKFKSHNKK